MRTQLTPDQQIAEWKAKGLEIEERGLALAKEPEKPRAQPKPAKIEGPEPAYCLWIPWWFPTTSNKLLTCHWAKAGRMKQADKDMIAAYFSRSGIPTALMKRRVDLHCIVPAGKRREDEDAFWKSGLDALVACGALKDDSPRWCEKGRVYWSRALSGVWGIMVLLRDQ
jgi:hypothetical protein